MCEALSDLRIIAIASHCCRNCSTVVATACLTFAFCSEASSVPKRRCCSSTSTPVRNPRIPRGVSLLIDRSVPRLASTGRWSYPNSSSSEAGREALGSWVSYELVVPSPMRVDQVAQVAGPRVQMATSSGWAPGVRVPLFRGPAERAAHLHSARVRRQYPTKKQHGGDSSEVWDTSGGTRT